MKTSSTLIKITFLMFLMISFQSKAQSKASTEAGVINFETSEIDYGTIEKGSDGERIFTFTNNGSVPIIIADVKASCGCTVPSKPKGPIMPGAMSQIKVKYDTNRIGPFSKTITVISNAATPKRLLKIKGRVIDPENKLGQ